MEPCARHAVNPLRPEEGIVRRASAAIRRGQVIAAPTDTLYGLLADARSETALRAVIRAKGRPGTKPILLLVDSLDSALEIAARETPGFAVLAEALWPGPLTMVVPARDGLSPLVTAGRGTVGIRLPDSPLVTALARHAGCPLTGTSANLSGVPGARSADEVEAQLGALLPMILDAGPVPHPVPSTVLDLASGHPRVLRRGAVSERRIRQVLGLPG